MFFAKHPVYRVYLAIVIVTLAPRSWSTSEYPVSVLQPIVAEEGIFLSPVTFVRSTSWRTPGQSTKFVCAESCIIDGRGHRVNRNAANIIGCEAGIDPVHYDGFLAGDTVRVFLDLSNLKNNEDVVSQLAGYSVEVAVQATLECVLTAAWKDRAGRVLGEKKSMEAKYVHVEIRGSTEYTSLGGTFSFEELIPLPRKQRYN